MYDVPGVAAGPTVKLPLSPPATIVHDIEVKSVEGAAVRRHVVP